MFISISEINKEFCKYDDGMYASINNCNHYLLDKLVLTAGCDNYWMSRKSIHILENGVDIISEDNEDIPYLELITTKNWITLLNGRYSKPFVIKNLEFINGWIKQLVIIIKDYNFNLLYDYIVLYINIKDAVLEAYKLYKTQIEVMTKDLDIIIFKSLVQVNNGLEFTIKKFKYFSILNRKKIISFIELYSNINKFKLKKLKDSLYN